ncbi:carboxymuconolactone decarboxylase family protein [uncultured Parasutterella sp.]|uniref:carboxymuconolactone decarboxylase family protein n=1 Tax=uncultured Parasutterella sp. TaxID=1263098 RepID=UPI0027295840|nr:carboxymuconolactone decarboxylase family protein [uncultured Parasutterella sp.]
MQEISRRKMLLTAAAGSVALAASVPAYATERNSDPDMDSVRSRMMAVEKRGTTLTEEQKYWVLLSTCAAQGLDDETEEITASALKAGVKPVTIKEAIYQTFPYVGIGRARQALKGANKAMKAAGIKLPTASQTTVNDQNRLQEGIRVQTSIFGDAITQMHRNTAPEMKPLMIDDLSGYCFGDFYTRTGMSIKDRELVVFAAIAALGGCESQLKAHTGANLKEGNTKQNLADALQIAIPLNGFPRTLNALAVVNSFK